MRLPDGIHIGLHAIADANGVALHHPLAHASTGYRGGTRGSDEPA